MRFNFFPFLQYSYLLVHVKDPQHTNQISPLPQKILLLKLLIISFTFNHVTL